MSAKLALAARPRRTAAVLGFCALLGVVVVVLAWGHSAPTQVSAEGEGEAVDFSLRIDDCIGGPVTTKAGDATCDIAVGQTFTAALDLNSFAIASYDGFDVVLTYAGVASKDNGHFTWPDCVFGAWTFGTDMVVSGCGIGAGAPSSTHTGELMQIDLNCTYVPSYFNTITLVHGAATGNTALYAGGEGHAEKGTETITVNCLVPTPTPPPPPTPTPVGGGGFFSDAADSPGGDVRIVTALIAAATAGAIALGGAAWYARRRRAS